MPFQDALDEADRLEALENDEETPYKTMYQARDVLRVLRSSLVSQAAKVANAARSGADDSTKHAANTSSDSNEARGDAEDLRRKIAIVNYRLGKNHPDTQNMPVNGPGW